MILYFKLLMASVCLLAYNPGKTADDGYKSENLEIEKISAHVYQHTSFLNTQSFGKVACNGMIVFDKNEAIIFDTPTDDAASRELIHWVENTLNGTIKAIIPTHFHEDCLGGLDVFHKKGIPSYANHLTIALADSNNSVLPKNGFKDLLELQVGDKEVLVAYFGEGHTKDNVIGYFPHEEVIFGGCLIKELGAGKGNLADANTKEWPITIAKLKEKYPEAKIVIPGHGKLGGLELLDYTIALFKPKQ